MQVQEIWPGNIQPCISRRSTGSAAHTYRARCRRGLRSWGRGRCQGQVPRCLRETARAFANGLGDGGLMARNLLSLRTTRNSEAQLLWSRTHYPCCCTCTQRYAPAPHVLVVRRYTQSIRSFRILLDACYFKTHGSKNRLHQRNARLFARARGRACYVMSKG